MPTHKKRSDFFTSSEGLVIAQALQSMVSDDRYVTEPSFSANKEKYADNSIPFIDKHMQYLRDHPAVDAGQYLANLKLMTRKR